MSYAIDSIQKKIFKFGDKNGKTKHTKLGDLN